MTTHGAKRMACRTKNARNLHIVGFVLTNKGLMYNLTLEGSKFTRLER